MYVFWVGIHDLTGKMDPIRTECVGITTAACLEAIEPSKFISFMSVVLWFCQGLLFCGRLADLPMFELLDTALI